MKRSILGKIKDCFRRLKKNRALYTLIGTILAFNMLIVATFAWFTLNRKMSIDEMGMSLAVDDTNAVYQAFMYNLKTGKGTDKNADGEPLTVTNIDLNQYDTIFRAQNKYTPVFAKIMLIRSESMPKNGTVYITVERTGDVGIYEHLSSFTSSIIRFTSFIFSDKSDLALDEDDELYADYLYSLVCTTTRFKEVEQYKGNGLTNSKTFVTVEGEGEGHKHAKTGSLTISTPYTANDWYINGDGDETLNVYLYITYDVQLVECYMDENAGGSLSLDDNSVFFDNDMKKISVSYTA